MNEPSPRDLHAHPVSAVERRGTAAIVRLAGELDLYNAEQLRASLLEVCDGTPERLVIDLEQVDFIDSTALGVLIEARSRLASGRAFALAAPGVETHRALQISGLDRHLAVHPSVDAALAEPLA